MHLPEQPRSQAPPSLRIEERAWERCFLDYTGGMGEECKKYHC